MNNISIQVFAGIADQLGTTQWIVACEKPLPVTVGWLKSYLVEQYPSINGLSLCMIAVNHEYAHDHVLITEQDEIALIPPVSGGDSNRFENVELTFTPIDTDAVTRLVHDPNHGATITFIGSTREWTGNDQTTSLTYESYEPMARKTMVQIINEIEQHWPQTKCAIVHRLGNVPIGETSVVIATSSPHRKDCYASNEYAIDRLKEIVPIWKKEFFASGAEWKGHQKGPWNPLKQEKQNGNCIPTRNC